MSVYISFEWKRNNDGAKGKNEKIAPKFLYTWILIIEFSSPLHEWREKKMENVSVSDEEFVFRF